MCCSPSLDFHTLATMGTASYLFAGAFMQKMILAMFLPFFPLYFNKICC
jgi:hypothetical protein